MTTITENTPEKSDDALKERSAAIMSIAQDIRPLEDDAREDSDHLVRNDPLAQPAGHGTFSEEQSDAILHLAQNVRPLENPPE